MILWSLQGLSPSQIAERVRFSDETVRRWIGRYEADGIRGLLTRPRTGRPRRVTAAYEQLLNEKVDQTPQDLGLPFSNWTTANLSTYMCERTGIEITPRQVENYLKAHGWRLRRPARTVKHKQDPVQVAEKESHLALAGAG